MKNTRCLILSPGKEDPFTLLSSRGCCLSLPFAGRHVLADIPLSNAVHSGLRNIMVLTGQPGPHLYEHIRKAYTFDPFSPGGIQIIRTETRLGSLEKIRASRDCAPLGDAGRVIILWNTELFRMDIRELLRVHDENRHDVTLSVRPSGATEALSRPLVKLTSKGLVQELGQPPYSSGLESWMAPQDFLQKQPALLRSPFFTPIGAMVLEAPVLENLLNRAKNDSFKDTLWENIWEFRTGIYSFGGHWSDLSSPKSYHAASLNLASVHPSYNLYDEGMPLLAPQSYLPPAKVNFGTLSQVLASDGVIINNAEVNNSLLGIRTVLESGVRLDGVVTLGNDTYEDPHTQTVNRSRGIPHLGVGKGSSLSHCLVGRNVRIGEGCRIGTDPIHRPEQDSGTFAVRDGLIIIPDETVIPSGTVL